MKPRLIKKSGCMDLCGKVMLLLLMKLEIEICLGSDMIKFPAASKPSPHNNNNNNNNNEKQASNKSESLPKISPHPQKVLPYQCFHVA